MFPHTLDDLPSKWFKLEEARGDTLDWKTIRHNFIMDFQLLSATEYITKEVAELQSFITQQKDGSRAASTCLSVTATGKEVCSPVTRVDLETDHTIGKSFRLTKGHPTAMLPVKTLFSLKKTAKAPEDDPPASDFPQAFTEFKEGERPIAANPPPEWLDADI